MDRSGVLPQRDVEPAAWLIDQLVGFEGLVRNVVPTEFEAVARVLHRHDQGLGASGSWSDISTYCQTTLHPLAQYRMLAGLDSRSTGTRAWPEPTGPLEGSLDRATLPILSEVLARHTTTPERVWFGLWHGWGGQPPIWTQTPTFHLPHRDYYLFGGALSELIDLSIEFACAGLEFESHSFTASSLSGDAEPMRSAEDRIRFADTWRATGHLQSPNIWWPEDRSWCVASEIDFDSTLVAGSGALVSELTAIPNLESFPVYPNDSLRLDADEVNMR